MMIRGLAIATTTILGMALQSSVVLGNDSEPKHYGPSELIILRVRSVENKVEVTFRTRPETWFWCPGANSKETKQGVEVTFVRCPPKQTCGFDHKAEPGRDFRQTLRIDAKGKNVFIKDGKKLTPLYKQPKTSQGAGKKKASAKKKRKT